MDITQVELHDNIRRNHGTRLYDFDQGDEVSKMVGPVFQRDRRHTSWLGNGDLHRSATHIILGNHSVQDSSVLSPTTAAKLSVPYKLHSTQGLNGFNHSSPFPSYYGFISSNSATRIFDQSSTSFRSGSERYRKGTRTYLMSNRRREQCRVNQARYRRKQDLKLRFHTEAVCKLKEEIPILELQRNRLVTGFKKSVFNVIAEYFHLFQHGILSPKSGLKKRVLDPQAQHQFAFLQNVAAPGISLGDQHGVDALMERWRKYSSSFDSLHFQLEHVEEITKNFMVVSASLTVMVVDDSLKTVFPHLQGTSLGDKILGRQLVLPCSTTFEWDEVNLELVRLEMVVDFVTSLTRALGSFVESAFVLGQAQITRDGSIKSTMHQ